MIPLIHVREDGESYVAIVGNRDGTSPTEYPGASLDEALGHAVRELWLGQSSPSDATLMQFWLTLEEH